MSNIYLCGITNESEYQNIKKLTECWGVFDGLIFGYDAPEGYDMVESDIGSLSAADGDLCWRLLDERKKEGKIIHREWTNDHDLQMNTFLREGPMKDGDWFVLRDSMERFNLEWVKKLPDLVLEWETQGILSVYNYGKGFAFKWNDTMIFQGSPHWGLQGARGKAIDLKEQYDEDKKEHTWRIRDGEEGGRPFDNKINHEAKYVWNYGRSNHLLLGYENRIEEFRRAEIIRQHIREVAKVNGFDLTIEGLKEFMTWLKEKDHEAFSSWINSHRVWKNFYRYRIAGEDFYEVDKTEHDWIYEKQ